VLAPQQSAPLHAAGLVLEDAAAARWGWVLVVYLLALLGVAIPPVKPFTPLLPATVVLLLACAAIALRDRQPEPASPRAS
jgi:hypothetical protein